MSLRFAAPGARGSFPASALVAALLLSSLVFSPVGGCRPTPTGGQTPTGQETPAGDPAPGGDRPWLPGYTAEMLAVELDGLDLKDFFDASWRVLLLRDPETVVAYGLSGTLGLDQPVLTDVSDAYVRETYDIVDAVLRQLREYDRASLSPQDQISYDIYDWYLDDWSRQRDFLYYDYPVTYLSASAEGKTLHFFTGLHPIASESDAEDYVARLRGVGTKFDQLIEGLELRQQAGVVPPRFVIAWTLPGLEQMAGTRPSSTPYYKAFREKLSALKGLGSSQKEALLEAAADAIGTSVLPGYQALVKCLQSLQKVAPEGAGVGQYPEGPAYYDRELDRIHAEMRTAFERMGYPEGQSLPELFDRVAAEGGYVDGHDVIGTYEGIINDAQARLGDVFTYVPAPHVVVARSPIRGVYEPPAMDGSRPGTFWAGPATLPEELFAMPTLAYHETVPGHHLQITYPREANLPAFRSIISFDGYAEGWALYAERLASELGWYEDDRYADLGRLQAEAFRAARLVVDTGLHAKGWTFSQAADFFREATGYDEGPATEQISRYVVWPGQATAYYVGMLKLLELRQRAQDELGSRFDLKEFHDVVLRNGSMPLEVLERVVDDYIVSKKGG